MTRAEVKEELYSYRRLDAERRQLLQELRRVEALMLGPKGANLDGMPHAPGTGDPVGAAVVQYDALVSRYAAQVAKMAAAQEHIESRIERLEPTLRILLRYRYLQGKTWEEVCVAMSYSWRQVHNLHARALDTLAAMQHN